MKEMKPVSQVCVGIVIAVIFLALIVLLKPEGVAGSVVYVKYYGISDYPISSEAGKIQTYVRLTQPQLSELDSPSSETKVTVANDIIEASDFANGLLEFYEKNPPAPVKSSELNPVVNGANKLADSFKVDQKCLKQIGNTYGKDDVVIFVITTGLAYHRCSDYGTETDEKWLGATAEHNFYTTAGELICSQESYTLFRVHEGTGQTSDSIANC